ncbi:MAG: hypothetical protein R3C46_12050 [Hyphomonadaceae bacterium]
MSMAPFARLSWNASRQRVLDAWSAQPEAIAWFTRCLSFDRPDDVDANGGKRWVVVEAARRRRAQRLLAKAVGDQQDSQQRAGRRTGLSCFWKPKTSMQPIST